MKLKKETVNFLKLAIEKLELMSKMFEVATTIGDKMKIKEKSMVAEYKKLRKNAEKDIEEKKIVVEDLKNILSLNTK